MASPRNIDRLGIKWSFGSSDCGGSSLTITYIYHSSKPSQRLPDHHVLIVVAIQSVVLAVVVVVVSAVAVEVALAVQSSWRKRRRSRCGVLLRLRSSIVKLQPQAVPELALVSSLCDALLCDSARTSEREASNPDYRAWAGSGELAMAEVTLHYDKVRSGRNGCKRWELLGKALQLCCRRPVPGSARACRRARSAIRVVRESKVQYLPNSRHP